MGRIGRPHGVRGEVTIEVRTDEPEVRFAPGSVLDVEGTTRQVTVLGTHWHSGRLLVRLAGVEDRNAAEALRGSILVVERPADERPDDPEEYYDPQLVGCTVEVGGEPVGEVTEIVHLPAQDLLAVRLSGVPDSAADVLVPFVRAIVPTVDVVARRIVVDPPAGLLDPPEG